MGAARRALITGITGQDGSYLAELLLEKEYTVYGLLRRSSAPNMERVEHLRGRLRFVSGDLHDLSSLIAAVREAQPQEIYNLAAQSFVQVSWAQPLLTADATGLGTT